MAQFNQSEVNSIREMVIGHQAIAHKLNAYSQLITDPQIKQMFTKAGSDATQSANKLLQMLQ